MKSLLFIVPSRSTGGTNSSLSAIYNLLRNRYDIDVLSITSSGNGLYDFMTVVYTNVLLDAYFGNFRCLRGRSMYLALFLKPLKRLFSVLKFPLADLLYKVVAWRIDRRKHYDVVIGFQETMAMRFSSYFTKTKRYTWIHCDYDRAVDVSIDELRYYKEFDRIVCVSQYAMRKFLNRYPTLTMKTCYIYNILDYKRVLALSLENVDSTRYDTRFFTILSIGRMDSVKRFSLIPRFARALVDYGEIFRWYVIGGPENEEFDMINREINHCGVDGYVKLLGYINNPYPYLRSASLLVSTSSSEACPMVFCEAKICGIPVVSTDFGSSFEFITPGVDGEIGSIDDLPMLIRRLMVDKEYYLTLKKNCLGQKFQNSAIQKSLFNLFD